MTRSRIFLMAMGGLILIVTFLWLQSAAKSIISRPAPSVGAPPTTSLESVPFPTSEPVSGATSHEKSKREVMRNVLGDLNHQPIEFYGRVIDQYGAPVSEAKVEGQVIYNTGTVAGVEKPITVTDADGYFSFRGVSGRTLDFNVIKSGYEFMPEGDAFDFTRLVSEEERHHPDPGNPVVVKMWKLQGAQPMIYRTQTFNLPGDGTPVRLDLETGKIVPAGGDLIITIKHGLQPAGMPIAKYDWSAEITVDNGGLIEAGQRVTNMHLAPEEGYVASSEVEMPTSRRDWSRTYMRSYYLKSRGGIYARISLDLHTIPSGTSYVTIKSWVNPSGSRNLEYDPSKQASAL